MERDNQSLLRKKYAHRKANEKKPRKKIDDQSKWQSKLWKKERTSTPNNGIAEKILYEKFK